MVDRSELDAHIKLLQHRATILAELYWRFLAIGALPETRVSRALELADQRDPSVSADLRKRLESLVDVDVHLGCFSHYFIDFDHGSCQIKSEWEIVVPILKLRSNCNRNRTVCAVVGHHLIDEGPELADARAFAVQGYMKAQLHPDALVEVEPHRCDTKCESISSYVALARNAEILISYTLDHVAVSATAQSSQSADQAAKGYIEDRRKFDCGGISPST